jgi:hypothetical protein
MTRAGVAAIALSVISSGAMAADNGFYIGVGAGQGNVETDEVSGISFDGDDTAFKAIAGFRPLDFLAFELNYIDLGNPSESIGGIDVEVDTSGIDLFAVGLIPLPLVDLYAKAGLVSWEAEVSAQGIGSVDDDGEDFAYGAGVQVRFGSLGVRAEYEVFEIGDFDDVNLLSVGVTWTFL